MLCARLEECLSAPVLVGVSAVEGKKVIDGIEKFVCEWGKGDG